MKPLLTGLAAAHLAVSVWHGGAHTHLAIDLPPEKILFVYVVVLIAPVVAASLVWTRYVSIGLWLFLLSMVGSFLFGGYHHYVLVSPDNISHLPVGSPEFRSQFVTSAGLLALLELGSALYGAFCLRSYRANLSPGE